MYLDALSADVRMRCATPSVYLGLWEAEDCQEDCSLKESYDFQQGTSAYKLRYSTSSEVGGPRG